MNRKGNRQHSPTPPKQKWQNICLALCILLGILASCETEESFYQPRLPANDVPLTRQALFKPRNFFAYTDSTLKVVISALRRVEDFFETYISNNVVGAFRQEGYDDYPFKEYSDITNIFPNIKLTTKNCNE